VFIPSANVSDGRKNPNYIWSKLTIPLPWIEMRLMNGFFHQDENEETIQCLDYYMSAEL
jgi:hypothetical protein